MRNYQVLIIVLTFLSSSVFSQTQLSFRFFNPMIIEGTPQIFQFDVEVKASESNTFLRDLQVYFDYNPLAFGNDILASGNATVIALPLLADHYTIVNQADNTSSKFAVITEATEEMNQAGSAAYFNEVPETYTGLLRFQIEIADANETAGIAFDEALMNGGQYRQSESAIEPVAYLNPCIYENSLENLSLKSHDIVLTAGWSGVSSYLSPFDSNIENLFDPIINELVILQNFTGMYFPGQNVNTLGNWNRASGYVIKVNSNCQLPMMGSETDNRTLNLTAGWNLMPILSECDVNTAGLFSSGVLIVNEVAGSGLFWPAMGINTIPLLKPGKAYFVKVAGDVVISFPGCNK